MWYIASSFNWFARLSCVLCVINLIFSWLAFFTLMDAKSINQSINQSIIYLSTYHFVSEKVIQKTYVQIRNENKMNTDSRHFRKGTWRFRST